jgi:hypothetical protein
MFDGVGWGESQAWNQGSTVMMQSSRLLEGRWHMWADPKAIAEA